MAIENPYQPPTTEVPFSSQYGNDEGPQRATRGQRLGAQMLDSILALAIMLPLQWSLGVFRNYEAFTKDYLAQTLWGAGSLVCIFALQGYFWATRAQSIGKIALGIKIVCLDGTNASFSRICFRRVLPVYALSIIPVVGQVIGFIDAVMIFGADERCLHDHIAGTRVVRSPS